MNWWKKAQSNSNWWNEFYYHMNNTADFVLQDAGIAVESHKNSINDGQRANFMIKASYEGQQYTIRIQLEFAERLNNLQFGPMGTGRLEGIPMSFEALLRSSVFVLTGTEIVAQQYLSPNDSSPARLMTVAKDAIISHTNERNAYSDYDPAEPDYE
tara:strand:- start:5195 stop:5662 length:468 start_codon:yes stop_codon:yes gene_type:complete